MDTVINIHNCILLRAEGGFLCCLEGTALDKQSYYGTATLSIEQAFGALCDFA